MKRLPRDPRVKHEDDNRQRKLVIIGLDPMIQLKSRSSTRMMLCADSTQAEVIFLSNPTQLLYDSSNVICN